MTLRGRPVLARVCVCVCVKSNYRFSFSSKVPFPTLISNAGQSPAKEDPMIANCVFPFANTVIITSQAHGSNPLLLGG